MRTQPPVSSAWLVCSVVTCTSGTAGSTHWSSWDGQRGEAAAAHAASALMPAWASRTHVTAHCGPNELPEAQAEYLMRLLSVNGYCDQGRVPVHLAEGLHNSGPTAGPFSPAGGLRLVPWHWDASTQHRPPAHALSTAAALPVLQPRDQVSLSPGLTCSSNQR